MSDNQLILEYFQNNPGWHNVLKIMQTLKPHALNWAVRSRISDINRTFREKQSHWIIEKKMDGKCAAYRLARTGAQVPTEPPTRSVPHTNFGATIYGVS